MKSFNVAIIGGGPAGLMAAEHLAGKGVSVTVYDFMPSVGRKFLMAGRGGLNLTHSEPAESFIKKYGKAEEKLQPALNHLSSDDLRTWCEGLGQEVFVGSSGRVFPKTMKASPLLRAWLTRLDTLGVSFALRHDWHGWDEDGALTFSHLGKKIFVKPDATVLALGGASWPRLGSDGSWTSVLAKQNVDIAPLRSSNCGFNVKWSKIFCSRFEGAPIKSAAFSYDGKTIRGEATITAQGIEGGAIYALSSLLRNAIETSGVATLTIDLRPTSSVEDLAKKLNAPRGGQSLSTYLRKTGGLSPLAIGLFQEASHAKSKLVETPMAMAKLIKAIPISLHKTFPIDRAISTAGGIKFDALNDDFMLKQKPGVFAAGEMLDWEAPTGGYLLQACFSTGIAAAEGALRYLRRI